MSDSNVRADLITAVQIAKELEGLVLKRFPLNLPQDRDRARLILGFWALVFDYQKSILVLINAGLYGGAFALLRPIIEAVLRAHVAMSCRPAVVQTLKRDKYQVDFKQIGPHLDKIYGMEGFFEGLIKRAEILLHSFTHSGGAQVSRRFVGEDVQMDFTVEELQEGISGAIAMSFMVTVLTTRFFGFDEEWAAANKIYATKAKHLGNILPSPKGPDKKYPE
jgi:hypothetical protein